MALVKNNGEKERPKEEGMVEECIDDQEQIVETLDERHDEQQDLPRLTKGQLKMNRAKLALLDFCLTYVAGRSILVMVAITAAMTHLPSYEQAVCFPMQHLFQIADDEAMYYHDCVVHAFKVSHNQTMARMIESEVNRLEAIHDANQQVLDRANSLSNLCEKSSQSAVRALQSWPFAYLPLKENDAISSSTVAYTNNDSYSISHCSLDDRIKLTNLLAQNGNGSLSQNHLLNGADGEFDQLWDAYLQSTRELFSRVSTYAADRAVYDYNYFVGLKIQPTLDLLDTLTLTAPRFSASLNSAFIQKLRDLFGHILVALQQAYGRVDLLTLSVKQFQIQLDGIFANYLRLYHAALQLSANIEVLWPSTLPFPSALKLNLTGISIPFLLRPDDLDFPKFDVRLPNLGLLASEALAEAIRVISELLEAIAATAEEKVLELLAAIKDQLTLSLTLEDYHPPKYVGSRGGIERPEDELELVQIMGDTAKKRVSDTLARFRDNLIEGATPSFQETGLPPITKTEVSPPLFRDKSTAFDYLDIAFPNSNWVPWWLTAFLIFLLSRGGPYIDFILQAFRLWKLKGYYESNAKPDLPNIDYETDGEEEIDEGGRMNENNSKGRTMALCRNCFLFAFGRLKAVLGSSLLHYVLMASPCYLLIVFVWAPHIFSSCYYSRTGTWIANQVLAPYIINKAEVVGNLYYTKAEFECQQNRQRICNTFFAHHDSLEQKMELDLNSLVSRYQDSVQLRSLLDRCIDTDTLDSLFRTHCCGLEHYTQISCDSTLQQKDLCPIDEFVVPPSAYYPIGEYLDDNPKCQIVGCWDFQLEIASFQCEVLESSCETATQCAGVTKSMLRDRVIEADCRVQSFLFRLSLGIYLVLFNWLILNHAAEHILTGVKKVKWRMFAPNGFLLKTQMSEKGDIVKGSSKIERSARIQRAIRMYEIGGKVSIIWGCTVFFLWFIVFFAIRMLLLPFETM